MPSLTSKLGSSSSSSSGGFGVAPRGVAACDVGRRGTGAGSDSDKLPSETDVLLGMSGASAGFSGTGVSSTSECLPVVQGSIARNSSKVRTRGLQHFQPGRLELAWEIAATARGGM